VFEMRTRTAKRKEEKRMTSRGPARFVPDLAHP